MSILFSSFKNSLKSAPYVLKIVHFYFGFYFIPVVICGFLILSYILGPELDESSVLTIYSITMDTILHLCLGFIVSYYTYKHTKSSNIRPFWTFIRQTLWPVIWNYYIKGTIIVLVFLILLIIPGIYKATRLSFIFETILFDNLYKQGEVSALKGSHKTTLGYFWPVCFVYLLWSFFIFGIEPIILFLLGKTSLHLIIIKIIGFILSFYFYFFLILLYIHFYFELKQKKGEDISC